MIQKKKSSSSSSSIFGFGKLSALVFLLAAIIFTKPESLNQIIAQLPKIKS